jgi:hypothetical protein
VSNIGSARTAVSRASAVVPTSNIASIEEVSDQVFSFLQSPSSDEMLSGFEGIQSGARVKQLNAAGEAVAYIQYNKNSEILRVITNDVEIGYNKVLERVPKVALAHAGKEQLSSQEMPQLVEIEDVKLNIQFNHIDGNKDISSNAISVDEESFYLLIDLK